MPWKPWDEFKEPIPTLPIEEPPCRHCQFWAPIQMYRESTQPPYQVPEGVRCCHAPEMERDFSCYQEKPSPIGQP